MEKTLRELAELIGGSLTGDGSEKISGLSNIKMARAGDLIFAVPPHLDAAKTCAASAVLIPLDTENFPKPAIKVQDPRAAFAKLLEMFTPKIKIPVGISPKAHIGKDAKISDGATIMPFAVIDDGAEIKSGVIIYPHVYIGQHATIGEDTVVYSSATVREFCKIGKRCVIHSSAVIGSDGFGFTTSNGVHTKVPQVGNVVIEDDVEIGAHVGIDRAAMGSTVIGHGTKIDNLVHIAHNCKIGANCLIVAQTGISGSTTVGDNVTFGGQVGTVGHIHIGGNSVYAARSGITKNMPEGFFGAGFPV
ncbi:MAG: UDP-3-O-(3-hydroxymyristoyl)glucosamine N-acyltransferase, partial [Selenomonadaceae bacterium]|nr:UDP-3-O-(3-hydroxymyristoyl)glucosamine N-acyltransferase [Selenomonadaceae bacterium]